MARHVSREMWFSWIIAPTVAWLWWRPVRWRDGANENDIFEIIIKRHWRELQPWWSWCTRSRRRDASYSVFDQSLASSILRCMPSFTLLTNALLVWSYSILKHSSWLQLKSLDLSSHFARNGVKSKWSLAKSSRRNAARVNRESRRQKLYRKAAY